MRTNTINSIITIYWRQAKCIGQCWALWWLVHWLITNAVDLSHHHFIDGEIQGQRWISYGRSRRGSQGEAKPQVVCRPSSFLLWTIKQRFLLQRSKSRGVHSFQPKAKTLNAARGSWAGRGWGSGKLLRRQLWFPAITSLIIRAGW